MAFFLQKKVCIIPAAFLFLRQKRKSDIIVFLQRYSLIESKGMNHHRKILIQVFLLSLATISAWGGKVSTSYTIKFGNTASSSTTLSSASQANTISNSEGQTMTIWKPYNVVSGKCYYGGDGKNNIRLGASGAASSLSITLSETGMVYATKIVVNCKQYNDSNVGTLSVNGSVAQDVPATAENLIFEYDGTEKIEAIMLDASKATLVYSITVYYWNAYTVTTTDYGYATQFHSFAASIPDGVTAFSVTLSDDGTAAILHPITNAIPEKTGTVLVGNPSTTYVFFETDEDVASIEDNLLTGFTTTKSITGTADVSYYAVNYTTDGDQKVPGFFAPKGAGNPNGSFNAVACKAYLKIEGKASSPSLSIRFDDTTGLNPQEWFDDSLFSPTGEDKVYYNLAGQPVYEVTRGIYILNGKKVVIR